MRLFVVLAALMSMFLTANAAKDQDVALFITIGQSNADGSAFAEEDVDKTMLEWYSTAPGADNLNIWYVPTQVRNEKNALGQMARHVIPALYRDKEPQWMKLWFRNDNYAGRTAMNMIHGAGTYSRYSQGRRGMEGEFGRRFAEAFPDKELYIIKLGVSGSGIDTWANPKDDNNWNYFIDSVYRPAIDTLLAMGKRPRLAGVWWMQGCADSNSTSERYARSLRLLIERLRGQLGFDKAPIYIGMIPAPGEGDVTPGGSVGYSEAVRDAQRLIASTVKGVTLINTSSCPMQYEEAFKGKIHFSHKGVNRIGDILADSVIAAGSARWAGFATPGRWELRPEGSVFIPSAGNPDITYSYNDTDASANLKYPGWTERINVPLSRGESAGDWELAWEDDFNGPDIDWKVWSKIPRGTANWNDVMSSADTLYAVRDGNLILRGIRSYPALNDTVPYVTGGLYTKWKKDFGYGRLEIRAKLQGAQGEWPAFWLLPAPLKGEEVPWPSGGEIDIMERLNHDDFAYQTVHSTYTLDLKKDNEPPHFATGKINPDDYNVFAVELAPDSLSFFINGVHTFTYPRIDTALPGQFPFDRPFYLLIDMQLGGSWVGKVDVNQLPVEMKIDRVSYYRRRGL